MVFTTIIAVLLFNAALSLRSVLAIICIVGFSILIVVGKKNHVKAKSIRWFLYAMGSFFCWGLLSLATKYVLTLGVPVLGRLIYGMAIVTTMLLFEYRMKINTIRTLSLREWVLFSIIGLGAAGFNYFMILGIDLAPNVGFVNAINASSIAAVTVVSAILFKDDLSTKKVIGVMGVTLGLIALVV